ncbi:MAG TPA: AzlD domain-containing protein [Kineosporiaceae bacterium]
MIVQPVPPLLGGILVLAAGTYLFRVAGPLLGPRLRLGVRARHLVDVAPVVLLTALVATAALLEGGSAAGAARPIGVVVAGALAWRRAPFVVVVIAAATVTAALRRLGVP